ncbi:MarR family transcriptional regulator, partial [Halobium palmae]
MGTREDEIERETEPEGGTRDEGEQNRGQGRKSEEARGCDGGPVHGRAGSREHEIVTTALDRFDLLELLLDEPADKRELTAALPVSRSTVNRALRDLERLDLVERVDGAYR